MRLRLKIRKESLRNAIDIGPLLSCYWLSCNAQKTLEEGRQQAQKIERWPRRKNFGASVIRTGLQQLLPSVCKNVRRRIHVPHQNQSLLSITCLNRSRYFRSHTSVRIRQLEWSSVAGGMRQHSRSGG